MNKKAIRRFYDRFGSRQDSQAFYENPALRRLEEHAAFGAAKSVLELGCGTGKFASRLLDELLDARARYLGLELSTTMLELTRQRIRAFGGRARCQHTDGRLPLPVADQTCDRFVACYVLDLMPGVEIGEYLDQARRCLEPGGFLCLVSLTRGVGPVSNLVSRTWAAIHRGHPQWVGGCRPICVRSTLSPAYWELRHCETVVAFGVPSEVIVAQRLD